MKPALGLQTYPPEVVSMGRTDYFTRGGRKWSSPALPFTAVDAGSFLIKKKGGCQYGASNRTEFEWNGATISCGLDSFGPQPRLVESLVFHGINPDSQAAIGIGRRAFSVLPFAT